MLCHDGLFTFQRDTLSVDILGRDTKFVLRSFGQPGDLVERHSAEARDLLPFSLLRVELLDDVIADRSTAIVLRCFPREDARVRFDLADVQGSFRSIYSEEKQR